MPKRQTINWEAMLTHFLLQNQYENVEEREGRRYTLEALAKDFGLELRTVQKRARAEGWANRLQRHLVERREQMLRIAAVAAGFDEGEIRSRHARAAKTMFVKGLARISRVEPDKLTVREAIDLMRMGIEQERTATGLSEGRIYDGGDETTTAALETLLEEDAAYQRAAEKLSKAMAVLDLKQLPPPVEDDAGDVP